MICTEVRFYTNSCRFYWCYPESLRFSSLKLESCYSNNDDILPDLPPEGQTNSHGASSKLLVRNDTKFEEI